ncbi:MAG: DNA translocase FtsK 4TM domain-containing protein [Desulfurivibrionaceae bacterium]|nr:DNA translocase FtsK 4TM domain-containing protein [Desulfobulbales bacterium]MDT8335148.1 DNA translocase FtsK 4TM domain-containing protein [Desulfurivibrionaceae bacterium]
MVKEISRRARPNLVQELFSVLGIFVAVFLLICLAGFSLSDTAASLEPLYWGGKVGSFFARHVMAFMGLGSFLMVLLLFCFSFSFFSPNATLDRLPHAVAGGTGILIAGSGMLAASGIADMHLAGTVYPVGGYIGGLLHSFLGEYFGNFGSVLFFSSLFLVSLMVSCEFSPYLLACNIVAGLRSLTAFAWRGLAARAAKNDDRKNDKGTDPAPTVINDGRRDPLVDDEREMIISVPNVNKPVRLTEDESADDFLPLPLAIGEFRLPGVNLLEKSSVGDFLADRAHYLEVSRKLESTLKDFGVIGKVSGISPGPIITTYEFEPAPGVKINKVVSLADDLAMKLKAESVRIVGSIPGKAALGIEIPNPERQTVFIRDILGSDEFQQAASKLTLGLGMDVIGNPVMANLARMPHLLIAGATGAGKSVAVNGIICSILMKATPEDVRLLMVDPKRIELSCYEDIPHLLHPVVVDPKMAARALQWAVREMERRYQLMEEKRVKSINSFNEISEDERLPLIVIIIDELADLMMVSSREVEDAVARLAQMARAAGMHLILATQRPSVDVLTGLIKANFPTRMSFKVSSKIDSRTILDSSGAEHLLGAGDMLFLPPGSARLQRIHGAYITEKEIENIVNFVKEQRPACYDESVTVIGEGFSEDDNGEAEEMDEKYDEAVALVCESGQASISMVQRRLRVGYNRAARMIELMEKEGVVGPADGSKPREVLARNNY